MSQQITRRNLTMVVLVVVGSGSILLFNCASTQANRQQRQTTNPPVSADASKHAPSRVRKDKKKRRANLSPANWGDKELKRFNRLNGVFGGQNVLAVGKHAVITGTTCAPAVRSGLEALRQGGSAADAVLTTSLAQIALAQGASVSCSGILTMLYYEASSGRVYNLNAGYNTVLAEDDPLTIPNEASGRTVLVPGYMAGVEAAHKRFGKLPFAALFDPAIYYAETGFRLTWLNASAIKRRQNVLSRLPATKRIFTKKDGTFYGRDDLFRQPELAATLRKVADQGAKYMYAGDWAKKLVAATRRDGGKLTLEDLSRYRVLWSEPLRIRYHGHEIYAHGLPAQGGVNVAEALNVAAEANLAGMGHYAKSPKAFFWLSQINNLHVLSFLQSTTRTRLLGVKDTSLKVRATPDHAKHVWDLMQKGKFALTRVPKHDATGHSAAVVAVDRWGNVAAICHTINTDVWGKTGIFVDGVSIPDSAVFQRRLIKETGPGKRLPDTTIPLIVTKNGKPVAAVSSIGSGLHQKTIAVLLNLIDFKKNIKEAVDAPSMHLSKYERDSGHRPQVMPDAFPAALLKEVERLGVKAIVFPGRNKLPAGRGYAVGISIDPKTGRREGVATSVLNARALAE